MSTSDSNNGAPANAKQIAANRANAKRSTGPKSAAGKLAVAKNGIEHGIYALCPVIADIESEQDWNDYRAAMHTSLVPAGMLEITLAERLILTSWRQRRVARYETEQIRLTQESATEEIGVQLGLERTTAASEVDEILCDSEWRTRTLKTVLHLADANSESPLSSEDAENLLWHVHDQLGLKDAFEDYWQQLPEPEAWTAGVILQLVRVLADEHGESFDELLTAVRDKTLTEAAQIGRVANAAKRQLDEYRRENLLPDNETLEKVMRYESHLSRLFNRDLHELQRLQAVRHGQPVAAPLAIDVDVTTGHKAEPDAET